MKRPGHTLLVHLLTQPERQLHKCWVAVSMATHPQGMLGPRRLGPSVSLTNIFRTCAKDPSETVASRLRHMADIFIQHFEEPHEKSGLGTETAVQYCREAEALYYSVLEAIITEERKRLRDKDLSCILGHDLFQRSLVACCVEMVLFSHYFRGSFCLVLKIFEIAPYDFYKVIELMLRSEEAWPPAVPRHLKWVEEQVLEELAWSRQSPLWDSIRAVQGALPTCLEVTPSQHLGDSTNAPNVPQRTTGDIVTRRDPGIPQSSAGLCDMYSSPPAGSIMTSDLATPVIEPQSSSVMVTGQIVVTMAAATVTTNNGQSVTIPVQVHLGGLFLMGQPTTTQQLPSSTTQPPQAQGLHSAPAPALVPALAPAPAPALVTNTTKHHGLGSLSLFLRKVYLLTSRRLQNVCPKLNISDELRLKIWTCLEHSLVHYSELMKDRHLNILLMCAIFIMAKVSKEDISFKHIMLASCAASGASSRLEQGEERRALINFYNTIYSTHMYSFAVRYSPEALTRAGVETPPYSPFPTLPAKCPHRLRLHRSFYISPLYADTPPHSPPSHARRALYFVNRSSPGCLHEINNMVKTATRRRPRAVEAGVEEDEEDGRPPMRRPWRGPSSLQRRLAELADEQARSRAQSHHAIPPTIPHV
ncbi:retinoblastoma-like protein 2 isoform X2 [Osmerus eperlanus]|uniref:retinoblastoma-like protein 2 isoform X2 n=1 Tax=Osmerus eperlanus TaxID=29151 RepID=UPI002E121453